MNHIVLLGDSIFDNARYVPGGPSVIEHLRRGLPAGCAPRCWLKTAPSPRMSFASCTGCPTMRPIWSSAPAATTRFRAV